MKCIVIVRWEKQYNYPQINQIYIRRQHCDHVNCHAVDLDEKEAQLGDTAIQQAETA